WSVGVRESPVTLVTRPAQAPAMTSHHAPVHRLPHQGTGIHIGHSGGTGARAATCPTTRARYSWVQSYSTAVGKKMSYIAALRLLTAAHKSSGPPIRTHTTARANARPGGIRAP